MYFTICPTCGHPLEEGVEPAWVCLHKYTAKASSDVDHSGTDRNYGETEKVSGERFTIHNQPICNAFNSSEKTECGKCKNPKTEKKFRLACPNPQCQKPFPITGPIEASGRLTVAGPAGSGKTTYIVALSEWWRKNLVHFGYRATQVMVPEVKEEFNGLRNTLTRNRKPPKVNQTGVRNHFSWLISSFHDRNLPGFLCTLPDSSGEDQYSVDALLSTDLFLDTRGVILIVDGQRILSPHLGEEHLANRDPEDQVRVIEAMTQWFHFHEIDCETVPIAVCVNKIDQLGSLGFDEITKNTIPDHLHLGGFDIANCNRRSDLVEQKLLEDGETAQIVAEVRGSFEHVMFFAMSTQEAGDEDELIWSPTSVEDPFLWIMYRHNLIEGREEEM